MNGIISFIVAFSFVFALLFKNEKEVSLAATTACADAVMLLLKLSGGTLLWSGLMRIAQKSGIFKGVKKILSPVLKPLFPKMDKKSRAFELISMNVSANMLGVGNAATPLGLEAMGEMQKINPIKIAPTKEMITFVVINCSSVQILPTTLATLRAGYGSQNPMIILPCVLLTSLVSLIVGISLVKLFSLRKANK